MSSVSTMLKKTYEMLPIYAQAHISSSIKSSTHNSMVDNYLVKFQRLLMVCYQVPFSNLWFFVYTPSIINNNLYTIYPTIQPFESPNYKNYLILVSICFHGGYWVIFKSQ